MLVPHNWQELDGWPGVYELPQGSPDLNKGRRKRPAPIYELSSRSPDLIRIKKKRSQTIYEMPA